MTLPRTLKEIGVAIEDEIERARAKFPAFHSQHEAYAVILEELDEFWDKVKRDEDGRDELIQIAAMAVAAYREYYTPSEVKRGARHRRELVLARARVDQ